MEPKKIKKSLIDINYDKQSDVVYITLGKPRPGVASELDEGDFIRVDPYTDEIVGITLMYFSERYSIKKNKDVINSVKDILPSILNKYRQQPKRF